MRELTDLEVEMLFYENFNYDKRTRRARVLQEFAYCSDEEVEKAIEDARKVYPEIYE